MADIIEIKLDERKLNQIEAMFRGVPGKLPQIVSRAINRTIQPAKTEIQKGIREEINIKAADAKEQITVTKATYEKWIATIGLSHSLIPILDFGAHETKTGVTFKVYKKGGSKTIKHAFITGMRSGHKGVFRRGIGKSGVVRWEKRKTRKAGIKQAINWHNVFFGEQFGPSLHQVFMTEKSADFVARVVENAYTRLEHNIDSQVSYVLSLMRTGAAA
jgi:hypothetical protein